MEHDVAGEFFRTVVAEAGELKLTSDENQLRLECEPHETSRSLCLTTARLAFMGGSTPQDESGAHLTMLERGRIVVLARIP
jgi:hypothetical protein